jgi:hypothetical protein
VTKFFFHVNEADASELDEQCTKALELKERQSPLDFVARPNVCSSSRVHHRLASWNVPTAAKASLLREIDKPSSIIHAIARDNKSDTCMWERVLCWRLNRLLDAAE